MSGRSAQAGSTMLVTGCAALGLVGSVLGLSVLGAVEQRREAVPTGFATTFDAGRVPAEFAPWIERAARQCPEVGAPLLAAQIEAESGWNPAAVSPVGAQGLSQFMPGTWATWGVDAAGKDGSPQPDGVADPFTPGDAIMTQARYDCWLADMVGRTDSDGDPTRLMLAAYNAGPGAVERFGGVPPYPETQSYVTAIITSMTGYTDGEPAATGGAFGDRVVANAEKWLGTPYSWGGGGPEGPGLGFAQGADTVGFDCSSLVQYAVYHASGGDILPPRVSQLQVTAGEAVARDEMRPGDVIGFNLNGSYDHIGVYVGHGQFIHAPRTGDVVRISRLDEPYFADRPQKVRRFG
ncbi:NlpC/P60 family protein [Streptomyces sp. TRM 70361]|uniref:NlpC/P60 family protein n=1 Tax=Streptomyces sp. TRM 70361 TaxID=3116553 RepID=UPI002E7B84F3|nr:NlpC/P60 family protein [Streptomyces sp. TRM 70361]MEE1940985.1 NlpC/P60 family protein [Streptomyces sp. TRM 70361]